MLGLQESKDFHPWQTWVDFCESVFPECVGEGAESAPGEAHLLSHPSAPRWAGGVSNRCLSVFCAGLFELG